MKTIQKIFFITAFILQISFLAYMIIDRELLLQNGKVIILKCRPIDPRSLFSGDYVILRYTISSFSKKEFDKLNPEMETFKKNDTVYLGLKKNDKDKFWQAQEISHSLKKMNTKYSSVIRGVINRTGNYIISYGIEDYFVPQYQGREIEKKLRDAYVEIALSDRGESGIRRLFVENREVKFY